MEEIADAGAPSRLPDTTPTPGGTSRVRTAIQAGEAALDAGAELAATAVSGVGAKFGSILHASGMGFRDPELLGYFRRWRAGRVADGSLAAALDDWVKQPGRSGAPQKPTNLDPASPTYAIELEQWNEAVLDWAVANKLNSVVPGSPLEYVGRQRSGKPHSKLELALGPDYGRRLPDRTIPQPGGAQNSSRWATFGSRFWPRGNAGSVAKARSALDFDIDEPASLADLRETIDYVLSQSRSAPGIQDVDSTIRIIDQLVTRYRNADRTLDDAGVRRLMGNKDLVKEDLVHRIIVGVDMMRDESDLLGPDLINDLLHVPGIESFIESVVHKSGFEVFLAVRDLFTGVAKEDLWMQVFVNGKMGPDIVKVLRNAVPPVGRIVQAKSYRSLNALLSTGDSGEIRRQILSDLRRIKDDGFKLTGPGPTLGAATVRRHSNSSAPKRISTSTRRSAAARANRRRRRCMCSTRSPPLWPTRKPGAWSRAAARHRRCRRPWPTRTLPPPTAYCASPRTSHRWASRWRSSPKRRSTARR